MYFIVKLFPFQIAGIHISVVAVGLSPDSENFELNGIASQPLDQNVFLVERDSSLPELVTDLIDMSTCDCKFTNMCAVK